MFSFYHPFRIFHENQGYFLFMILEGTPRCTASSSPSAYRVPSRKEDVLAGSNLPPREGCRAWSKALDLGSSLAGVQGFESLPSHSDGKSKTSHFFSPLFSQIYPNNIDHLSSNRSRYQDHPIKNSGFPNHSYSRQCCDSRKLREPAVRFSL